MKTLKFYIVGVLFINHFSLWSQLTVPDTICIFADNPFYSIPVTANDPICQNSPPGQSQCFVLSESSECVRINVQGFIQFNTDPKECCGNYTLYYIARKGTIMSEPTPVYIEVKCPKPDCKLVELVPPGPDGSAGGGQQGPQKCLHACENSTATYFYKHVAGNSYTWNVIGGTFTIAGPGEINVSWGPSGSGVITLTVTNGITSNVYTYCVDILPGPTASFTKSDSIICLKASVSFVNTSNNATSYYWDFGDGNYSTAVNPTHSYALPGTYTVTLIATKDNYGPGGEALCCCSDTMQMDILVEDKCGPDIQCISTVCEGDSAKYWTTVSGCTFTWSVNDANGNPVPFTGQGNDTICVAWGTGPYGVVSLQLSSCIPNIYCTKPVSVNVPIIQNTSLIQGPTIVCAGEKATYELPKWLSVLYHWQVTGGMIVSQDTNSHTITIMWGNTAPSTGMITAQYESKFLNDLPIHDENECSGMAIPLSVNILPKFNLNSPPSVVCVGDVTNLFTTGSAPNGFTWTSTPALTGFPIVGPNTINIVWPTTGNFTICATPNAPNPFCNTIMCRSFTVLTLPPPDSITGPMNFCPGDTLYYFGHSTTPNKKFKWTVTGGTVVGGGNMFTGNPVAIVWGNTGPYSLVLSQMMINAPQCMSPSIIRLPVMKSITGPLSIAGTSACVNALNNYSISPAQHPDAVFSWSLSNPLLGSIQNQGSPNIQVQWNNTPGPVTLSCTVTLCGVSQTYSVTLNITAVPPPVFSLSGFICPGGSANLTASGSYTGWSWSTGGNTSTISINTPGVYTVTVSVGACSTTGSYTAYTSPLPVASISTPDVTNLCIPGGSVTIYAMSNPGYTYAWTCNGGPVLPPASAAGPVLTHPNTNVAASFSYQVAVTDNITGCMNLSNIIIVSQQNCGGSGSGCSPAPASVSATYGVPACNQVTFTPSAGFTVASWAFADGLDNSYTGTLQNPTHTYNTAGCRVVYATGTVANTAVPPVPPFCVITVPVSVCVPLAPAFNFTSSCDTFCFNDLSTFLPTTSITGWTWNFGDGSPPSNLQNPCHIYGLPGVYPVTLTVTDGTCIVSRIINVTVPPKPLATFTMASAPFCAKQSIQFIPVSTAGIISNFWQFGDMSNNGGVSPLHSYMGGTYTITFTQTDVNGCTDSTMQTITVNPMPMFGPITVNDNAICQGDTATLTAPTASSYVWSNGATTQSITVTVAGSYNVTVSDANNCSQVLDSVKITVFPAPPAIISGSQYICDDGCIMLTGNVEANAMYNWLYPNLDTIPWETSSMINICKYNFIDSVYYKIKDGNGCINISGLWLIDTVNSPLVTIIANDTLCEGTPNLLTVSPVLSGVTYQWNTGANTTSIIVNLAGTYTVYATDTLTGCVSSATEIVHPRPDLCYVPVGCYKVCTPFKLCGPEGLAMYQWCFNGNPISGENGSMLMAEDAGIYNLKAYTSYGCVDTSGALILETMLCCESGDSEIIPNSLPSTENGCCYSFDYYLGIQPLQSLSITSVNANMNINFGSLNPGFMITGSTNNSVVIEDIASMPLDTGNISNLIDLCFSGFSSGPIILAINWYDSANAVVCTDTLLLDCDPQTDCIYVASDSIHCVDNQMEYSMTLCNPTSNNFPIGYLVIDVLSPTGIPLSPLSLTLSPPLLPGQCTTLVYTFPAGTFKNQYLCYNITAHESDPSEHPEVLCCMLDSTRCIFIPGCEPCDSVYIFGVQPIGEDSCCFAMTLDNYGQPDVYTSVSICVITTEQTVNMIDVPGDDWTTTSYTPAAITMDYDNGSSTYLPEGYVTLPTFCIDKSDIVDTEIEIKWMDDAGNICRDTTTLFCSDCGRMQYTVVCKDGQWYLQMTITNYTPNIITNAFIDWCDPALTPYDLNVMLGTLNPYSSYGPFLVPIGSPALPNIPNCVNIILRDKKGLVCCKITSSVTLPDCETTPSPCLCDKDFYIQVDKGIQCTNQGLTYTFSPLGTFDPECDKVYWEVMPNIASGTTLGNESFVVIFPAEGEYEVCMTVYRIDAFGNECKEKYIKQVYASPLAPPEIWPNPSQSEITIFTVSELDKKSTIRIFDLNGKLLFDKEMSKEENVFKLNISNLYNGMYRVKLINEHREWSGTFIKIE